MPEQNLVIDVHNLKKYFNQHLAVKDISLQVKSGEILGFLGPNGSGKTTTIRMLCGLLKPDGGYGTCVNYDVITQSDLIKQHIGYIPQHFSLYKELTVYENILFMAEIYGVLDRKNKAEQIIEQLNLKLYRNHLSGSLSGGWKQRLSLATALIHKPLLLLLDEPTANVDPKSRQEFWDIMHNLSSEGMTILLSSHNMDEVENCHKIVYVYNGKLILSGKIKEIITKVNLTTWIVRGSNLKLLAKQLRQTDGVDQIISFFDTLHVSSRNKNALLKAIKPYKANSNYQWSIIESALDDVFIWLANNELTLE